MTLLDQAFKNPQARFIARTLGLQLRDRRQFVFDMLPLGGVSALIGMYRPDVLKKLVSSTTPQKLHLIDPFKQTFPLEQDRSVKIVNRRNFFNSCKEIIASKTVTIHDEPVDDAIDAIGHNTLDWVYINRENDDQIFGYDLTAAAQMVRPGGLVIGEGYAADRGQVKRVVDGFISSGKLTAATINNNIFVLKKYTT